MSWDGGKNCCCDEGGDHTHETTTVNTTEVLRTRLDITAVGNINGNANPNPIEVTLGSLDEIGVVAAGSNFTLPAGNYEIEFTTNHTMQGGTPRVNFNFQLRQGTTVIDEAYGGVYMRNENDHNQAGNTHLFELQTTGGTYNIASIREASPGVASLDGGWIIIRRYEQKQVVATVTL